MWLLLSAVVTASLLGSLHCVGMCGPLAIWASGVDRSTRSSSMMLATTLYHFGRGITYTIAGLVAGGLGQLLDWSGGTLGIQLLAARVVGGLMIALGSYSIYRSARPWLASKLRQKQSGSTVKQVDWQSSSGYVAPKPNWITAQLLRLRPLVVKLPPSLRGLVVGLLTALLPCGWLYLFALLAAGTGSLRMGALVMAAFWLGSVPLLVGLVAGTRLLTGRAGRLVPFGASVLLIVAGAYTASGRGFASLAGQVQVSSVLLDQLNDGVHADSIDPQTLQAGIEQLVATPLPCCQDRLSTGTTSEAESSIARALMEESRVGAALP